MRNSDQSKKNFEVTWPLRDWIVALFHIKKIQLVTNSCPLRSFFLFQNTWNKLLSIFECPKKIFHRAENSTWKSNTKLTLVVQQSGTLWHVIDPMHFGKRTNYSIPFPQLDSESAKLSISSKRLMPEQLAPPFKTFYCLHCDLQSIISFENSTSS